MKIESNKNWTTCLRLNTGDGSPRVFLLNSHFLGSVPGNPFFFCLGAICYFWTRFQELKEKNGEISKKNHKKRLHLKRFRV